MSETQKNKRNFLIFIVIFTLIGVTGSWLEYKIEKRNNERRELAAKQRNAALAKQLNSYSDPIIQAIYKYKDDHREFPKDLLVLVPQYLPEEPYAAFGEELVYFPNDDYYGAPFYFAFNGHYSGLAFMHGWSYKYCPSSSCSDNFEGVYRIDENWIFMHSSAL
jgi:hypothetical protein